MKKLRQKSVTMGQENINYQRRRYKGVWGYILPHPLHRMDALSTISNI